MRTAIIALLFAVSVFSQGFPSPVTQPSWVASVGGVGTFLHPYGVKVHGDEVWVSDTGGDCIHVFNKNTGAELRKAMYGTVITLPVGTCDGAGTSHPYQLDFASNGNVYVGDNNADSCAIYILNPTTLAEVSHFGSCGSGDGQFPAGAGIAIRGLVIYNDEVYVGDITNNRIQVFDLAGNYVRKFSTYGPPARSAYSLAIYNNEIYVAEGLYIQVYSLTGVFKRTLSISGQSVSQLQKFGIVNGELWVSDENTSQIHILDPVTGVEKRRPFGRDAQGYCIPAVTTGPDSVCASPGRFNNPGEIALDTSVSPPMLYIADIENYRYQKFSWPFGDFADTPVSSVNSGAGLPQTVTSCSGCLTFSTATSGASIYYNTTGSPACGTSTLYSGALSAASTATYYWIACKNGYTPSAIATATLTVNAYLIDEGFEATGTPTGWTTVGTVDFDSTAQVAEGAQSLALNGTSTGATAKTPTFTAQDNLYQMFWWYNGAGTPTATKNVVDIYNSSNGLVCQVKHFTSGVLLVAASGGSNAFLTQAIPNNTWVRVWVHYTKGTGSNATCRVWWNTTDTHPGNGSTTKYNASSNGTATTQANHIWFYNQNAGTSNGLTYIDGLRIDGSQLW